MEPIHVIQLERLEDRITPDLTLANVAGVGHAPEPLAFEDFENPSPIVEHPNFGRSQTALDATENPKNPTAQNPLITGNEGPWSAHYMSPNIVCTAC